MPDPRVYDLAKTFLANVEDVIPDDVADLAEEIQSCIEGFIIGHEHATKERKTELQDH